MGVEEKDAWEWSRKQLSRCIRKLPVGNTVHAGTFGSLHFSSIWCQTQSCEHFPSVGIGSSAYLWYLMLFSIDYRLNNLLPKKYFCCFSPCALHLHSDIDTARRENSFPFIFYCSLIVMTLLGCERLGISPRIHKANCTKGCTTDLWLCCCSDCNRQCGKQHFLWWIWPGYMGSESTP